MNNSLSDYLNAHSLPLDSKIFVIVGQYDDLRQELVKRGWVEHEQSANKYSEIMAK